MEHGNHLAVADNTKSINSLGDCLVELFQRGAVRRRPENTRMQRAPESYPRRTWVYRSPFPEVASLLDATPGITMSFSFWACPHPTLIVRPNPFLGPVTRPK
jgi:hypothetical protein